MDKQNGIVIFVFGMLLGLIISIVRFNFVSQTWDKGAMYPN